MFFDDPFNFSKHNDLTKSRNSQSTSSESSFIEFERFSNYEGLYYVDKF